MSFDQLRSFLASHGQDRELTGQAVKTIELYASIVETGRYRLASADELRPEEIVRILSGMSGKKIGKLLIVSVSVPGPTWTDPNGTFDGPKMWRDVDFTLWERLYSSHHMTLWESFPRGQRQLGNQLWELLEETLGYRLKDLVAASLPPSAGYELRTACGKHVWYALFYSVAMAMNGVKERVERLKGLPELLARALPLGEKHGAPDSWYVLAA